MTGNEFSGQRLTKADASGMKGMTADRMTAAAIEIIPKERMTDIAEMDSYLMSASGFKVNGDQGALFLLL